MIDSIKNQSYDKDKLTIFVVADNCTDNTATIALSAGAVAFKRKNTTHIGKGYALDFLIKQIDADYGLETFTGFFVFDADNLLDENYIAEMNNLISQGYSILTSYRNSKNYATNWISAGYSLWFLREARFLNGSRMSLKTGCAISGTGFFLATSVLRENQGWPFHLLTEDIEFSVDQAIRGNTIGYCSTAIFYDEQPETFSQSWKQRMRWTKGFYQVFGKYGLPLTKAIIFKRNFQAYDMLMTVFPGMIITSLSMTVNLLVVVVGYLLGIEVAPILSVFLLSLATFYTLLFTLGLVTVVSEWARIHCATKLKIVYLFTFPLFMLTYMPMAIPAMFSNVGWQPIRHTSTKTLSDVRNH